MPEVLSAFVAFVAEHRRCGVLNGGVDGCDVWLECSCGGLIVQPFKPTEPPSRRPAPAT
jgi:hypothetical protein